MSTIDIQYPQILDVCITHLQDGSMTYEACLAQYPLYAEQLQQDLTIVQLTQQITVPQLNSQSVDALEAKLLQQFNHATTQPKRPVKIVRKQPTRIQRMTAPYLRWVAGFVIAIMMLAGVGGGTVYASSSSLPGEPLYVVKIAWEQVIIFIATLLDNQDDVWLQLTQTRANEILLLYEGGRLSDDILDTFYSTAETAILVATDDTKQAYLDFVDELEPLFSESILLSTSETRRFRILLVLSPELDSSGQLMLPDGQNLLPQPDNDTPTVTPTLEPTATATLTATQTLTMTPMATATHEPTQTRTPTPSRTPTLVSSATLTMTPTSQPTATWTPLGIQPRGEEATTASDTGNQTNTGAKPTKPFFTGENNFFVRETEQAVELTQTAIAATPTDTTP